MIGDGIASNSEAESAESTPSHGENAPSANKTQSSGLASVLRPSSLRGHDKTHRQMRYLPRPSSRVPEPLSNSRSIFVWGNSGDGVRRVLSGGTASPLLHFAIRGERKTGVLGKGEDPAKFKSCVANFKVECLAAKVFVRRYFRFTSTQNKVTPTKQIQKSHILRHSKVSDFVLHSQYEYETTYDDISTVQLRRSRPWCDSSCKTRAANAK